MCFALMTDHGSAARLIGEDRDFQEAYWTFQRLAWIGFGVFIAAALLGFAGAGGPFAKQVVRSGSALVEAPRIMRWEAEDEIHIRQASAARESVEVMFSPELATAWQTLSITPVPFQSATTRAGTSYWFFLEPGSRSDIVFHVKPQRPALRLSGHVAVGGQDLTPLSVTVLP